MIITLWTARLIDMLHNWKSHTKWCRFVESGPRHHILMQKESANNVFHMMIMTYICSQCADCINHIYRVNLRFVSANIWRLKSLKAIPHAFPSDHICEKWSRVKYQSFISEDCKTRDKNCFRCNRVKPSLCWKCKGTLIKKGGKCVGEYSELLK